MLNKIMLHGRLTKDPELRHTNSGKACATWTLAVDRDREGADFITCVAWEKRAEFVHSYFAKGKEMIVSGRLQMRSYEDKNGNKRTAAEVVVDSIDFCGTKGESKSEDYAVVTEDDDDLPF